MNFNLVLTVASATIGTPKRMKTCKGVTKNGVKCKTKVRCGDEHVYCTHHIKEQNLNFYPYPNDIGCLGYDKNNWPPPRRINMDLVKCKTPQHLVQVIRRLYKINLESSKILNEHYWVTYHTRLTFTSVIENLKYNKTIFYENPFPGFDKMCNVIINRFVIFPEFNDYIIDFQKQCIKNYRIQAQKCLYLFYFKHVEGLCFDVVEKIINLM